MFAIGDAAMLSTRGSGMTYKQIREELKLILKDVELSRVTINKSYIANSIDEINAIYLAARDKDLEGVIVKNYNAKYVCKRDKGWMKIKDKQTVDVEVKDVVEGEGKYQGSTGKLVVDYNGVSVGVGSGLSDRLREKFWHRPDEIIGKIIEVSFHEETPDKSLRHPVFECVRIDKTIPNTEY
jgi:DNA ligase-1